MKLVGYEIDVSGTPTTPNNLPNGRGWTSDELNGNLAYQVIEDTDAVPSDYADISSIENWAAIGKDVIGFSNFMDWKCQRNEIDKLADIICSNDINTNFGSLNAEEQKISCQYLTNKVSSANFIATYSTLSDRTKISLNFDVQSSQARKQRYYKMRSYLMTKIGSPNGLLFFDAVIREGRINAYIGGIESKSKHGVAGIEDIIKGTDIYTDTDTIKGLEHRSYDIVDGSNDTLIEVCDELINIKNGLYG